LVIKFAVRRAASPRNDCSSFLKYRTQKWVQLADPKKNKIIP